jgi:hypothetical protein
VRSGSNRVGLRQRLRTSVVIDGVHLGMAFTLLAYLVLPPSGLHVAGRVLMAVGLILPLLVRRSRLYWTVILAFFAVGHLGQSWSFLDNHEFLQIYWLAAITASRFGNDPDEVLRSAARWLLALVFAFAVLWKLIGPGFVGGAAMEFITVTDPRMADVVEAAGIQPYGSASEHRTALDAWMDPTIAPQPVEMAVGDLVSGLAPVLTWLTILLEAAVAAAFLTPLPRRWRWLRDVTLLAFVASTYVLAPVIGFGWLLLAMGVVQSDLSPKLRNRLYVAGFAFVSLTLFRGVTLLPLLERLAN